MDITVKNINGIPIYSHHKNDVNSFIMFSSLLVCVNCCKQIDIVNSFGVTKSLVSRNVAVYVKKGPSGFFEVRKDHGGTVLTKEVLEKAQHLLNLGEVKHRVADVLGIKHDTLRKAIASGRLSLIPNILEDKLSTKSLRTAIDSLSGMGTACTRETERIAASQGLLKDGARPIFEKSLDVRKGGILCAIPALLVSGYSLE